MRRRREPPRSLSRRTRRRSRTRLSPTRKRRNRRRPRTRPSWSTPCCHLRLRPQVLQERRNLQFPPKEWRRGSRLRRRQITEKKNRLVAAPCLKVPDTVVDIDIDPVSHQGRSGRTTSPTGSANTGIQNTERGANTSVSTGPSVTLTSRFTGSWTRVTLTLIHTHLGRRRLPAPPSA